MLLNLKTSHSGPKFHLLVPLGGFQGARVLSDVSGARWQVSRFTISVDGSEPASSAVIGSQQKRRPYIRRFWSVVWTTHKEPKCHSESFSLRLYAFIFCNLMKVHSSSEEVCLGSAVMTSGKMFQESLFFHLCDFRVIFWSLVLGHSVPRRRRRRPSWTEDQIDFTNINTPEVSNGAQKVFKVP